MVTSNKQTEKKVVKMASQVNTAVVPHRTLLGEVNEHITCPLCRGYYIDATTIVECLHSFCRSCIIKHLQDKKYCPVCEMMINSAKPNIKLDKALQDIVYKLVPGLFQKEMERRQAFYASRPGPAASATPEQRGEDTERIIFSPEDVISFSLEFSDVTDNDSISSKSSDSNEPQSTSTTARRYLQCPAVVNISHLKKFLGMKFDIDSTQFAIDILYKRVPLPDYYTLMDIAYIYNWKRNEPMRFFYQIIDYVAIRNRLFDINRKGTLLQDKKPLPALPESSNVLDQVSETSSGTDSPMPDESSIKKSNDLVKKESIDNANKNGSQESSLHSRSKSPVKKSDDEDEKSQFLNSFELTAKSNAKSPVKPVAENVSLGTGISSKSPTTKTEETMKRKLPPNFNIPELKKVKIELEKAKVPVPQSPIQTNQKSIKSDDKIIKNMNQSVTPDLAKSVSSKSSNSAVPSMSPRDTKHYGKVDKQQTESPGLKRPTNESQASLTPKRKPDTSSTTLQKTVSPLKIQLSKTEAPTLISKVPEIPKVIPKKMPDLKPSTPGTNSSNKGQSSGKLRLDLLANNCDPTIDRSKILSQVKTAPTTGPNTGENLKSLFDSCKINIPSSLSITLTDQKSPSDSPIPEQKKNIVNKNLANANNTTGHKVPSPPVHNYIEIKKLPDTDTKKLHKPDGNSDTKSNLSKTDNSVPTKPLKTSETSAKGPIPNLKPIADTKLAKQSVSSSGGPITFQQTFEQQLQSLQTDSKTKGPKNKAQVPKLVPASPKSFSVASKLNNPNSKSPTTAVPTVDVKPTAALDLSTPHTIQSQLGPQQTKAFETMQSIANLAKKQNLPPKSIPLTVAQNMFPAMSRPVTVSSPLRGPPSSNNQTKQEKPMPNTPQNINRQDIPKPLNPIKPTNQAHANTATGVSSPSYPNSQPTSSMTQPSSRSQTRSPSSSPKLVIAEDKQSNSIASEQAQANALNTQLTNIFASKSESKDLHNMLKPALKPMKPLVPPKLPGILQPIAVSFNPNTAMSSQADYLSQPLISHAIFRQQMEMQNAWLKAQRQYDLYKNMPNMAHQNQNDFNNKDKK